jgi:alpha-L-rhamnosidase
MSVFQVVNLTCNYEYEPLGIGTAPLLFSWKLQSALSGIKQKCARIILAQSQENLDRGKLLWDSGNLQTWQSAGHCYCGKPLESKTRYWYRVTVECDGIDAQTSADSFFETGIADPGLWQGHWISAPTTSYSAQFPEYEDCFANNVLLFYKDICIKKQIKKARLYATAKGTYQCWLNGQLISEDKFAPGWTDFSQRIYHQTYDVTDLLNNGDNRLTFLLADGWYAGYIGLVGKAQYGSRPSLLAQLEFEYEDGTTQIIATDKSFCSHSSPILFSDQLQGECQDMQGMKAFYEGSFEEIGPQLETEELARDHKSVLPRIGSPMRVERELPVKSIKKLDDGRFVLDFGQNMSGIVRIRLKGTPGQKVTLQYGEMLNGDGTVYRDNLRKAAQADIVILGKEACVFQPLFTCHGFRYMEILNYDGSLAKEDATTLVIFADLKTTGSFHTGHEMVNRLQKNIEWGQRSNFLTVPTDCPQRDERLGWLGDAQVFIRTASFNMDVVAFFHKWIEDLADAQLKNGSFPDFAPITYPWGDGNSAWAEAGVIIPYTIWRWYDDKQVLRRFLPAMERFMDWCASTSDNGIRSKSLYGDWLSVGEITPIDVLSTAYYAYCARLMRDIYAVLGDEEKSAASDSLYSKTSEIFAAHFIAEDGTVEGDTQTGCLLALSMTEQPTDLKRLIYSRLKDNLYRHNLHLTTGFVGVNLLLPVLSEYGDAKLAYSVLFQDDYPSWFYSIKNGATTIWERWNSYTLDKGFADIGMNSFNHYSLGSVGEWFYRYCAGIDFDMVLEGWHSLKLRPLPNRELGSVHCRFDSVFGPVESHWVYGDSEVQYSFSVPPNVRCRIFLDAVDPTCVVTDCLSIPYRQLECGKERLVYEVLSGTYTFRVIQRAAIVQNSEEADTIV